MKKIPTGFEISEGKQEKKSFGMRNCEICTDLHLQRQGSVALLL